MSLAGDVIDGARDMHSAFTNAQTPQAVALRLLNGARRALYTAATRAHRASFMVTMEYPLLAANVLAGLTLAPSLYLENVRMSVNGSTLPLGLLESANETNGASLPRYGVVRGRDQITLHLYPRESPLWVDTSAILVDAIPALPDLTTLASDIGMGAEADGALASMLVVSMAGRGAVAPGAPPFPMADFRASARNAYDNYMTYLAEQRRSKTFQVLDGMA